MLKVVQKFGIVDAHGAKFKIAQVELLDGLPGWVGSLVTNCSTADIRYALDRYAEPLVRELRYTPIQCLDRVPPTDRVCAVKKGCVAWNERACTTLKTNVCRMLEMPAGSYEVSAALTDLINLWRDGYYVVVAT